LVDPRYGQNAPHQGMPKGHLPVRSYLAVSVVSRSGEVLGGLLFGHPEPGRFTERHESLMTGIAAHAAVAVDNARLFGAVQQAKDTLERRVEERTAELTESERRFRGIFDSALQFMALLSPDGTVLEVNQTALSWSQVKPEDIVGKPFWLTAPMRGDKTLQSAIEAGVHRAASGETVRAEYEMRGAGEVRAFVDFSLKAVPGPEGKPIWLVAEGRDITSLKAAQEALRQSQKMEAMGQLTGGVAHDFNNLLTPIVGSLDMLQRKEIGGERERRLIAGAAQSAERARTLVQRLLAFARRQPLQTVPVDVAKLVRGMADLVSSTTGPQIKVVVEVSEDVPAAMADPNQLEMAILNLSVNARDAMPEGGTLRISATSEVVETGHSSGLLPGGYICLSVADTGAGMDEATLARAVEPFFSTKGIGRGTGLGLSMVHGLASQLGGALVLRSSPGLGTNVKLWLPRSRSVPVAPEAPLESIGASDSRGTALLVDDEELVRMSTADMLTDLGYYVIEAASAEQAMRLFQAGEQFDLLVTDHLMPGMSGADLARAVRTANPGLPILLVSGYAENEGIAADLPRLTKPFRKDELAASLAELVGSS
jgi:PAS domain S-box-containing protein